MRMIGTRQRAEHGFVIAEVLVAMLVLGVVIAAASETFTTSHSLQTRAKLLQRQSAVADATFAALRSDSTWASSTACATALAGGNSCDATAALPALSELVGATDAASFTVSVSAAGIDTTLDGTGSSDGDSREGDYVQVTVTVSTTQQASTQLSPLVTRTAMRATGAVGTGVAVVHVCAIWPQVDERVAFTSCEQERTISLQTPSPSATPDGAEWQALRSAPAELLRTRVFPVEGARVRLSGSAAGAPRTVATDERGQALFEGLPADTYTVQINGTPANLEQWPSHSRPTTGELRVDSGNRAAAILALRPASDRADVDVEVTPGGLDEEWEVELTERTNLHLVPVPLGRDDPSSASGSPTLDSGSMGRTSRITFRGARPGLYAAYAVGTAGTPVLPLVNVERYIWVDPDGSIAPVEAVAGDFTKGVCRVESSEGRIEQDDLFDDHGVLAPGSLTDCTAPWLRFGRGGG